MATWPANSCKNRYIPHFIGSSAVMVEFYKQIARIADSWANVLIEGEIGADKELAARSLHQLSCCHRP